MNKVLPDWINDFEEGMEDALHNLSNKNRNSYYHNGYLYGEELRKNDGNMSRLQQEEKSSFLT